MLQQSLSHVLSTGNPPVEIHDSAVAATFSTDDVQEVLVFLHITSQKRVIALDKEHAPKAISLGSDGVGHDDRH